MEQKEKALEAFINEQVRKWKTRGESHIPVITFSTEPGSGGHVVAKGLADRLGLDLFDRDIIKRTAESVRISDKIIETMEKERLSGVKDFISSLVNDRYLWPGVYLQHMMKVVGVIAKHGRAVIVGRGANFIIPPHECLAVRVVAPLETRVNNVSLGFGVTEDEARRRILKRENRRAAFVRESFNADVADPNNYDLVINTGKLSIDAAIGSIIGVIVGSKHMDIKKDSTHPLKGAF